MDQLPPAELARWCQQTLPDDTRAFETLVSRYKKNVFATAYRILGSRPDAEDVAQESFLKIYRGIKDLTEPATLTTWIYRITTRTCFDFIETKKRRGEIVSIDLPAGNESEQPAYIDSRVQTPEEAALTRELRNCLEKALASLDADGRSVIVLRDIEDRSYQEIAEVLSVGLSAVKMRIHRARLGFQKLLEQVCPGVARVGLDQA